MEKMNSSPIMTNVKTVKNEVATRIHPRNPDPKSKERESRVLVNELPMGKGPI